MPRGNPLPWFRPNRNTWYATIDGVQDNLRTANKREAYDRWRELLGSIAEETHQPAGNRTPVVEVSTLFADHCERHTKSTTYEWYRQYLESFAKSIPRDLTVGALKPFHVTQWLDRHAKWKSNTQRGAVAALKRAFQWAIDEGYIDRSPVASVRKAPAERRETILSADQRKLILAEVSDDQFRDFLTLMMETGARPQEIRILEARHVDVENGVWVLPPNEHKTGRKTRKPRVVYLTPAALAISKRLAERYPAGSLLRNRTVSPGPETRSGVGSAACGDG